MRAKNTIGQFRKCMHVKGLFKHAVCVCESSCAYLYQGYIPYGQGYSASRVSSRSIKERRTFTEYIRDKRRDSDKMIEIADEALRCVPESFITHDFRDDERRKPGVFEHIIATGIKKLAEKQGMIYLPEQSAGPGPDIFVICPQMAAVFVFGVKGAYVRYPKSKEHSGKGYVSVTQQRQNDYLLELGNFFSTKKRKKNVKSRLQENVESIGKETAGNGSGVASALPDLPVREARRGTPLCKDGIIYYRHILYLNEEFAFEMMFWFEFHNDDI